MGVSYVVLETMDMCGRYPQGRIVVATARMDGHDVAQCLKIFSVRADERTQW